MAGYFILNANRSDNPVSLFSRKVLVRLLALSATMAFVLGCVVLLLYSQERNHETFLLEQQGLQRIDHDCKLLETQVESLRSDLLYLAEQDMLQRFLSGDEAARDELANDYVHFAQRRGIYDQIRFLDMTGKEAVRVNCRENVAKIVPITSLQVKTDRDYYQHAVKLDPGKVFVSDFDLNIEHGKVQKPVEPVVRFLTPVADSSGTKRGLLALNCSGKELLDGFDEVSLPGITLLINAEGEYIQAQHSQDNWGWLLGHDRNAPAHFPDAWKQFNNKTEGQFSTPEGLFTFRRFALSQYPRVEGSVTTVDRAQENLPGAEPLILVTYVPPELQTASSSKLLSQLLLIYAGAMILIVTLGWYWARSAAIRKRQASSIAASESRLRTLSNQILDAQEQERRSISRELHDELGQQATAVCLDLQAASHQQDPERTKVFLGHAIQETDHLLQSLHEIASRVRPPVLDDLGLHDAVESLTADIDRRAGISVDTKLDFDDQNISPRIGENVYRIAQEGLRNIAKHAQAQHAFLTIKREYKFLRLILEDNGVGCDLVQIKSSRLGILGMQERTELLGGSFAVFSEPGAGMRIDVTIPLENENN